MSNLRVRIGESSFTLDPGTTHVVGRGRDTQVTVEDPGVSRHHAELTHDGTRWVYTDRSSAGSFVHDQQVSVMAVDRPVTVRLGPPGAPEVELEPAAPPAPPAIDIAEESAATIGLDDDSLRLDVGDDSRVFPPGGRVVIGRDPECDFVIADRLVSGRHCIFEWTDDGWMLDDLGSTRGTWVDGREITTPTATRGAFHVVLGDDTAGVEVRVVTAGVHVQPKDRRPVIIAGAALLLGIMALGVVLWRSPDPGPTPEALPLDSPIETAPPPSEEDEASDTAVPAEDIAGSVVQPVGTLPDGRVCSSGSGTHVGDGLVLTNFHVIGVLPGGSPDCRFRGEVAVAESPDQPTVIRTTATIVAVDPAADLAVLRLADDLGLPALEISTEQPALGSRIRIFGFPGIGGGTLTVTSGQVSGFLDDVNIGPGAWIKTDATVAGGNSGGAAVDDEGRLIGVPTIVGAGSSTETVECRALADTNGDGVVDDTDTCVSVGGFLNGIRPVDLASGLLSGAATATPFDFDDPALDLNAVDARADFAAISVDGLRVDGFDSNGDPVDQGAAIEILCATYEFSGIDEGLGFVSVWLRDEVVLAGGYLEGFWGAGREGETTSCYRPLGGIAPGTYVFGLAFGLDFDASFEVEAVVG